MPLDSSSDQRTYAHIPWVPSVAKRLIDHSPSVPESLFPKRYRWYPDATYNWRSNFFRVLFGRPSHFLVTACDGESHNRRNNSGSLAETSPWHFHMPQVQKQTTTESAHTRLRPSPIAIHRHDASNHYNVSITHTPPDI